MGLKRKIYHNKRNGQTLLAFPPEWVDYIRDKYGNLEYVDINIHGDTLVIKPLPDR